MPELIRLFKDITEIGNKTRAEKVNLTLDTANVIVKYIETLENKISTLEEENSNLLEMVES